MPTLSSILSATLLGATLLSAHPLLPQPNNDYVNNNNPSSTPKVKREFHDIPHHNSNNNNNNNPTPFNNIVPFPPSVSRKIHTPDTNRHLPPSTIEQIDADLAYETALLALDRGLRDGALFQHLSEVYPRLARATVQSIVDRAEWDVDNRENKLYIHDDDFIGVDDFDDIDNDGFGNTDNTYDPRINNRRIQEPEGTSVGELDTWLQNAASQLARIQAKQGHDSRAVTHYLIETFPYVKREELRAIAAEAVRAVGGFGE